MSPRRTLLQRLFKGGLGRPLINLWIEDRQNCDEQRHTYYKLNLGRYCVLQWESIRTNMDALDSRDYANGLNLVQPSAADQLATCGSILEAMSVCQAGVAKLFWAVSVGGISVNAARAARTLWEQALQQRCEELRVKP